jgi:hypothetical protein
MSYGPPRKLASGEILVATAELGGEATWGQLRNRFSNVGKTTLSRRLDELIVAGALLRAAQGSYALPNAQLALPPIGQEIVGVLKTNGIEGHLSGFDLLGAYAHQFVFEYPHIVLVEPSSYDSAAMELVRGGFVVVAAGPAAVRTSADTSRLVLLRPQPDAEKRFGVRRHIAPVEKAWVDLLRETLKSRLPFQFLELGRILRNLDDRGADRRRLSSYATRLGYAEWVHAAHQQRRDATEPDMRALVAGYWSP